VALLSVVAAAGAVVLSPTAAGLGVETVLAADSVSVVVDVVRGTKGASGSDQRSNKHSSVLGRVPGYGGWKFLDSMKFSLSASGASAGSGAVAGRTLAVKLESFAGGKAKTRVSVTDPGGRDHKITSSLGKGGTTVLTAQSSGGREVHLFIVTVNW
tara:strand:+ start:169 stop:636 length:468 start_codon:yes stop_codon:yes gene_type:complete